MGKANIAYSIRWSVPLTYNCEECETLNYMWYFKSSMSANMCSHQAQETGQAMSRESKSETKKQKREKQTYTFHILFCLLSQQMNSWKSALITL